MRGFLVVSKKTDVNFDSIYQELDEFRSKKIGIYLNQLVSQEVQYIDTMGHISEADMAKFIAELSNPEVQIHLFKFIHDLFMVFGNEKCNDLKYKVCQLQNLKSNNQCCPAIGSREFDSCQLDISSGASSQILNE